VPGSSRIAARLGTNSAVTIAVAAAAAYYIGSWIGLQLRLPPATPSVVWPPNAILTALLLFVPPRRWWTVLLGAAAAHFMAQLPVWSPAFVTGIFLTNCSEALIAAGGIRYFSEHPSRLDTLRRMAVFVVIGGVVAPLASTFLDAGVVSAIHGEPYWTVWKMRLLSNVLAQLAIVPAVLGIIAGSRGVRRWSPGRWLEAAAITGGLILVAFAVAYDAGRIGLQNSPLAPFLPLLLWAAVRFGSAGVGLSVLATVLAAVVAALYGDGLFPMIAAEERIRTLQVFLISATLPLLCVGALVEERRRVAAALRSSDSLKASILTSIPSLVAVIDRNGRILTANASWRTAHDKCVVSQCPGDRGTPYLEVWAAAADRGSENARAGHDGIRSVLDGTASGFALEYRCDLPGADRWWMMSVVPLLDAGGGAVITHTDITARKRAELEVQRSRDELAHTGRVWVMGELTASLSHQLKQPLTGIVGNALAGRRFLDAAPPNLGEIRNILTDIADDAQRASDVTGAIRDMIVRDAPVDELLDVNDVVRHTTMLVTSEAASRNVSFQLQLAPSLPAVRGRRVQLSQVVLNLAMNAMEAFAGQDGADARTVTVRTECCEDAAVQVSVADTGCGLPRGAEEQVFEPLFTTKTSGMGMGLPIARAIVEAHGGTLAAYNGTARGSTFRFTLPAAHAHAWS
jgi:signal transduction histidine kinase/integral membrane sensor domain MASE1